MPDEDSVANEVVQQPGEPEGEPKSTEIPIEIEVVDDTPEPDRGKAPPTVPPEQIAGSEADDESLTPEARKRVKQLRYVYHEERRNKEKAERESNAAIDYAKQLLDENRRLKNQLSTGERVLLDQAKSRSEAQIESAKAAYRAAHDAGDSEAILKASEALTRAVNDHQRFSSYVPTSPPPGSPEPPPQPHSAQPQYAPQQPQAPPVDDRTQGWLQKNPWFGAPGYEEVTSFAMGVHTKLSNRGVLPTGTTADEYWDTVNRRLTEVFPAQFGAGAGQSAAAGAQGSGTNGRTTMPRTAPAQRPVVMTAGARSSATPIRVKLTQSQLTMARRLGLTAEQYAREVAKEQH